MFGYLQKSSLLFKSWTRINQESHSTSRYFVPNCSYIGLLVLHHIGNLLEQSRSCVLLLDLQKADPSSDAFNTVPLLLKVYVASLVGCASLIHSSLTQAFCTPYSGMWTVFCSDRNTSEIQNLSDFLCFRRNCVNLVN